MQMSVSVSGLSFNRRRIGSLQSGNDSSGAELVVLDDGVAAFAVFDGLLRLGKPTGGGDVGDGPYEIPSRFHTRSDGLLMDVLMTPSPSSFPQMSKQLSRREKGGKGGVIDEPLKMMTFLSLLCFTRQTLTKARLC